MEYLYYYYYYYFGPKAPGRREDDLPAEPGLQLAPTARWRHGPGVTVSPAATASGGGRRCPVWRCGPGGVTAWPVLSGAVLGRCACYGSLALSGAYLDALGVHFGRLGYQDLQNAVLG